MGLRGLKATLTSSDWPHISPPGDRTGAVCAFLHSLRPSPSFHPSLKPPLNHNKFIGKWDWEGWGYLNTKLFWLATHLGDRTGALCASLCSSKAFYLIGSTTKPTFKYKKKLLGNGTERVEDILTLTSSDWPHIQETGQELYVLLCAVNRLFSGIPPAVGLDVRSAPWPPTSPAILLARAHEDGAEADCQVVGCHLVALAVDDDILQMVQDIFHSLLL